VAWVAVSDSSLGFGKDLLALQRNSNIPPQYTTKAQWVLCGITTAVVYILVGTLNAVTQLPLHLTMVKDYVGSSTYWVKNSKNSTLQVLDTKS
jgi:hypothetical protein